MNQILQNGAVADATAAMIASLGAGPEAQQAMEAWCEAVLQQMLADEASDERVLASRGYRRLTAEEKDFYAGIKRLADNPRASFADIVNGLPITVLEDVFKNLVQDHPLLAAIDLRNAGYNTKLMFNDHTATNAAWSDINEEVSQEIASSFRTINMTASKLSCYAVVPMDLIRMDIAFIDRYVRTILTEALAGALEKEIVTGDGDGVPIGMNRKLDAQAVITSGSYAEKDVIPVTSFAPQQYGALIAQNLLVTDGGNYKNDISGLGIICHPADYLNLVMPATTTINASGSYVGGVFPIPTKIFTSIGLTQGTAILGFMNEYCCGIGTPKEGNIDVSNENQFVEDTRAFKAITYANGRAFDNSSFIVLDISELEPGAIHIKGMTGATGATGVTGATGGAYVMS